MTKVIIILLMSIFLSFGIHAQSNGPMGVERIARFTPLGYESKPAESNNVEKWLQIDLGYVQRIDSIKLYPFLAGYDIQPKGFPLRFSLEASNDSNFKKYTLIKDYTYARADYPDPYDAVQVFNASGVSGRYVRLTATALRQNVLALSKLSVFSDGKDVAQGCPISDLDVGYLGKSPLTRKPRPQGEDDITDNPGNVIPARQWKPVAYKAQAPLRGVVLDDGIFKTTMDNNIIYLLNSSSVDKLLLSFRERDHKVITDTLPPPNPFWDVSLAGSNAGRFLGGAGNTLQWMKNPELRNRLNQVVNGIAECRGIKWIYNGLPPKTQYFIVRGAPTQGHG